MSSGAPKPLPKAVQQLLNASKAIFFDYPFLSGFISTLLVSIIVVILSSFVFRDQPNHASDHARNAGIPTEAVALTSSPSPDVPDEPPGSGAEEEGDTSLYAGEGEEPTGIPTSTPWPPTPTFTATPFIPTRTPESFLEETETIEQPTEPVTDTATEPETKPTIAIPPDIPPTEAVVAIPPVAPIEQPVLPPDAGGHVSRGIGLDIATWEAMHGQPTGENTLGYEYRDGAFIIIPQKNNNIWHLERVWDEREANPIDDARNVAIGFIPADYQFLGSQQTSSLVERYHSRWLATRFPPEMDWDGGTPGDFMITYSINHDNRVMSFMITTGNHP